MYQTVLKNDENFKKNPQKLIHKLNKQQMAPPTQFF